MKKIILYIFFLAPLLSKATNYYISATGSDTNNGKSKSTPWLTLNKANSFNFSPTDSLLLRKGDTFKGALVAKCNVSSYGIGKLPVISGLSKISSWVSLGGNLYQSPVLNVGASNTVGMVLINGVQQPMGRYPKKNYDKIVSRTANTITGSLNGFANCVGGTIAIRIDNYLLEKKQIVSQNGGSFTFTGATTFMPRVGWGYFIQNCAAACTQQNDWYYDAATKRITIYSTTKPSFTVEYTSVETPVTLSVAGVSIRNIRITGGNTQNLEAIASNCTAHKLLLDNGQIGAKASSTNFTCSNSTIRNMNTVGVTSTKDNTSVLYNLIENIGLIPGSGGSGATGNGASLKSRNNRFIGDTVRNTGYNGIYIAGKDFVVKDYAIFNSCTVLTDGGAVYTDGAVEDNSGYIGNGIALDGSSAGNSGSTAPIAMVGGIYLDNDCTNIEIAYNTVFNMPLQGIFLRDGHKVNIHDNVIYNCTAGFSLQEDGRLSDISFYNNSITAIGNQHCLVLKYFAGGFNINRVGKFNNNIYSRPGNDIGSINTYDNSTGSNKNYSLATFQRQYNLDINSKSTPSTYVKGSTVYPIYTTAKSTRSLKANADYQSLNGKMLFCKGNLMKAAVNSGSVMYKVNARPTTPASGR